MSICNCCCCYYYQNKCFFLFLFYKSLRHSDGKGQKVYFAGHNLQRAFISPNPPLFGSPVVGGGGGGGVVVPPWMGAHGTL